VTAVVVSSLAGRLLDEPGRYDLPEADYHRDPLRHLGGSASSTTLRKMLPPSCPALARHAQLHPQHKSAYDLGTVTHALTLGAGRPIVEVQARDWTEAGAAGRTAKREARARGAVAMLSKELAAARAMRDAVHADAEAHAVLTLPGAPEQTLIWREDVEGGDPVWCRAMLDRWPEPTPDLDLIVGDLKKTAKGLDRDSLQRTVWQYGYHLQEDLYRRGYHAVHGVWPEFSFIFVTDEAPHLVRVVQVDAELRAIARRQNDEALALWRTCLAADTWPGYGSDIAVIGPPSWARNREDYYR